MAPTFGFFSSVSTLATLGTTATFLIPLASVVVTVVSGGRGRGRSRVRDEPDDIEAAR